jgi:hypothetical protein
MLPTMAGSGRVPLAYAASHNKRGRSVSHQVTPGVPAARCSSRLVQRLLCGSFSEAAHPVGSRGSGARHRAPNPPHPVPRPQSRHAARIRHA